MNRIDEAFRKGKVFASYITADKGKKVYLFEVVKALSDAGVNLFEIGVPFSDPIADGPVIQEAMQKALENETSLNDALNLGRKIREITEAPLILFTYINPILAHGKEVYDEIKKAGFDGLLIVDLPFEEASEVASRIKKAKLDPIFILTPSTSDFRASKIVYEAQGFIYYVCQKGTTGVRDALPKDFESTISKLKSKTSIPFLAGFGISNYESAKNALNYADGFVVGSAIVKMISDLRSPEEIKRFAESLDPRKVKHGIPIV